MTRTGFILAAAGGSAALMIGALGFQYIGDMPPCKLCYWQRYPHIAAIGIGVLALFVQGRGLPALGMVAALCTAFIGAYHSGVELKWWEGPSSCTSSAIGGLSTEDLMSQIMAAPLIRCDDIPWEMLGLSMAGWNMVFSFAIAGLWAMAFKQS